MDPAQWQHIKELFASALEREPEQRNAFLKESCGDDNALREEVESLVAAHQQAGSTVSGADLLPAADQAGPVVEDKFSGRRVGHYQFLRRIGQGGMAAVYLAIRADDQYKKRVAIKLIPPGLDSEELLRRFRNERQTLAALDHPNIVKLLDGGTTEDGLPYLVMDYVEGTPIDEYCDAHRLSTSERLELFRKVCTAVSYAHQRLVIHRDLKPGNILATAEGTPKLLDFGIAKLLSPESAATLVITHTGQRLMTPEYASPEQVRGEPLTNATDVYSLGVVLYEVLTGHCPYHLKSYLPVEIERAICETEPLKPSTMVTRVEEEKDSDGTKTAITPEAVSRTREGDPKKLRSRLHGDLDAIVLTALRKEPQRRYASIFDFSEDIRKHLEGLPVQARPSTIGYRSSKFVHRHKELAAAMLVFVAVLGGVIWEAHRENLQNAQWAGNPKFKSRRSMAVLGFKNLSGRPETNWLSTALSEMLNTELSAGERLRMIPGENVVQMKLSLALPDTDSLAPNTLARVRKNLGSDFVVLGSYLDLGKDSGEQVRLDLYLQDATVGETVAAVSETGTEAQVFDLVARAGTELREKLGIGGVTPAEATAVKATLPSNTEAARLYAEGLAKQRIYDNLAARDLLQRAVAADPNHALAHAALAEAWKRLGYDENAKQEAKKAKDLSSSLSREEQLWIEGRHWEIVNARGKAIEIYKQLFRSSPDNLDYGLRVAEAEIAADRWRDAVATLEALRKMPVPDGNDPRIDLLASSAAYQLGDFDRMQVAASTAAEKAGAEGARLVVARARCLQANAFRVLGRMSEAMDAAEECTNLFTAAGDRSGAALGMRTAAWVLLDEGDLARAHNAYEQALSVFRQVGDNYHVGMVLNDMGVTSYTRGDFAGARNAYKQALEVARQIQSQWGIMAEIANLGMVLASEGNLREAEKLLGQAAEGERQMGMRDELAYTLSQIGSVMVDEGELDTASKLEQQAVETSHETGDKAISAEAHLKLGKVMLMKGSLAGAHQQYDQALQVAQQGKQQTTMTETRSAYSELLIEEAHLRDAENAARQVKDESHREGLHDPETVAASVLVTALLAQGKTAEAQQEIENIRPVAATTQSRDVRLRLAIASARVHAARGRFAEAKATLRTALAEAAKFGFLGRQFGARLALGEIEMKFGQATAGRARLARLEKDANAKGFLLIARKAAATRG